jgi:predicted permease
MRTDLRYALRAIRRDRGFAAMVVLSLALGIGANTAIFSMVNGVLLRPLAFHEPERLVEISQSAPAFLKTYPMLPTNIPFYYEWRKARSFESMAAMRPSTFNLTGAGEPEVLEGAIVSANLFTVLGVNPRLGRSFLESENPAGHERVVVIADSLWRRRFHADPGIIGRSILLDGISHEVVGVLAAGFRCPRQPSFGPYILDERTEIYRPFGFRNEDMKLHVGDFNYWVIGRLRPGVSVARAYSEMNAIQAGINERVTDKVDLHLNVAPLQEEMVGDVRRGLLVVMSAVGAVLLILCVNLANLSLARAAGRARDSAIRTALGAGRWRLVRQSLAESTVLAVAGGALGIGLAWWGLHALIAAAPVDLPRLSEVHLDARVLAFSLGTGVVFGILPALRSAAAAPFEALKSGSHTTTEARRGVRLRNMLVAAEVGLSALLLVGAGLLLGSFTRLMRVDKGFDIERVLALEISLPRAKYTKDPERVAFFDRVLEKARAMPGTMSASLTSVLPLQGESWIDTIRPEGDTRQLAELPSANVRFVSPGYFKTLHIPLREGRDFEEADRSRHVSIISGGLAGKLWPGRSAIGRKYESSFSVEVTGITPDIRSTRLDAAPVNMTYLTYWERPQLSLYLLVRTGMDPRGAAAALRSAVWQIDSEVPVPEVRTLEQVMAQSVAQRRFQMMLVALFAAAALALAAFGTYGVVGYAVARRRPEMGIRMALGAKRGDLLRMVLRQGMAPVIAGLAIGGAAALAAGTYMASLLFEMSPRDPLAFSLAVGVLLLVSAAACFVPARRATRVNPIETLRFE